MKPKSNPICKFIKKSCLNIELIKLTRLSLVSSSVKW